MKQKQINKPRLSPGFQLIDTHCHLDMDAYSNEVPAIVSSAAEKGVKGIITVGIDLDSSHRAIAIAKQHDKVWATIGLHPHNADSKNLPEILKEFDKLASEKENKIVGYGEIGLDFAKNYAPRDTQISCFQTQLALAKKLNLPIIIHDREAHAETMEILLDHAPFPAGGVLHCFSGDLQLAQQVIDLGLHISIPGIVTFKNSSALQQVAQEIPLSAIILETDGPFLAPVPFRGKTNRPEYMLYTAEKIALLRNISLDEVAQHTTLNAERLFGLNRRTTSE